MIDWSIVTAVISLITGGGVITGIVAFTKDRRDARSDDLDFTQQIRDIAKDEVDKTRKEMDKLSEKVTVLEGRIVDLEASLKVKERIIGMLVDYVETLRTMLNGIKPTPVIPAVPKELHEYIKGEL